MSSHMWARKMCGEGCVNIVFLVLTHIVDSCAHACASTRPHSLLSSSGRNWIWWRDGAVQIVQAPHQSRSFYRVLWKLHLIPAHSLSVSSWQVWFAHFVKSEHATIGYWKSWVNTLCVIISYWMSENSYCSLLCCSKIPLYMVLRILQCVKY